VVGALVLGIVVLAVILVSGSGSSSKGTSSKNNTAAASGTANSATKNNSTKAPSSTIKGGELKLPGDDPLTLDPALAFDTTSAEYIVEIFGGLVQLDKQLHVIPDIAKEMPTVSADGKVYTFKLRDDVVFQNSNRRVTASDFKYSMERAASQDTGSTTADQYLGDIIGAKDMIRGKAKDIPGIKVIDDQTLEIDIDASKPFFLSKLTFPTAFVVDKQQIESDKRNWSRHPNGTGPFKLKEWKIGESITLVANDRYHLGAPQVGQLSFSLAGGSALTQYENGEIDISGVSINDIERIRDKNEPLNKEYVNKPVLATFYVAFNAQKPPFDDPKVRQAFSMAIDKKQLVDVILKNIVQQADGILPPGMPGYNKDIKGLGFDAARAKQLIQESKYQGKLPPIQLTTSGQGASVGPVDEAILQMWKDNLGVTVEVQQVESATFLDDAKKGKYQMWDAGWEADYPDPENFLDLNFYSGSSGNDVKYNNPEVDKLLLAARTELDANKRAQEYQQAEQLIVSDAGWLPLFYEQTNILVKPYVKGYEVPGMIIPIFRYVSLQK
jgi:oligopeptide transport system substrate-binding protein